MFVGVTGCAVVIATPPTVDVMDVGLVGLGLMEQQLAVTLCVTKLNTTELSFRRVTADLDVSGSPLAAGASNFAIRLPPLSSTAVPFTVATTLRNLGPQLLGVVQAGGVDYRVHGTVSLQGSLGLTLPYSRSSRLDPLADGRSAVAAAIDPTSSRCLQPTSVDPFRT